MPWYRSKYDYPGIYSGPEFYTAQTSKKDYTVVPWRSIYLRKFLVENNITFYYFPYEDNLFMFQCYILANRVGFLQKECVLHRHREGSLMTSQPTIKNVRAYYITANKIEQLCFEFREKLENFPDCFQRAAAERNNALRIYRKDPETFRAQAVDPFDKAMLKELDRYLSEDALESKYKKSCEDHVAEMKAMQEKHDNQRLLYQKNYEDTLREIYNSASWKVGNTLIQPFHFLKKLLKH